MKRLHPNETNSEMTSYIVRFAATFGINDMKRAQRMPNTRRALAMAEFARDEGKLNDFRLLAMDAYWKDSNDIEDSAVLRGVATASGLDPEKALFAADDQLYLKRVDDRRLEYKQVGVGGIPTFVFGKEAIEGCQPYQVLAAAALRAGAKPR